MADARRYRRIAVYSGGEIIGDGVYKLPFLRALRSAFPEAVIDWVCPGATVYADRIAPLTVGLLDHVHADVPVGQHKSDLFLPMPLYGGYDLVIDTQQVVWRSLCARRLSARGRARRYLLVSEPSTPRRICWPRLRPSVLLMLRTALLVAAST